MILHWGSFALLDFLLSPPHNEGDQLRKGRIAMQSKEISDAAAAAAFRRLVTHLQHRHDAENIDLMGLAGFCRNCLADWVMEAANSQGDDLTKDEARELIHGMPAAEWKAKFQAEATPEQLQRMKDSVAKNAGNH
jgi:uncharacterized protein